MTRRERPVLVYDGDCGFCTTSVRFAERHLPMKAEAVAWQFADLGALGITVEQVSYEVVWVDRFGRTYGGAQAAARLLMDSGGSWRVLGALATIRPFSWIAHGLYRLIANNRYRLPGGTPACALPPRQAPGT
jgi:predicted DCC family thiol-disulfide oxidoreductase YuxK